MSRNSKRGKKVIHSLNYRGKGGSSRPIFRDSSEHIRGRIKEG